MLRYTQTYPPKAGRKVTKRNGKADRINQFKEVKPELLSKSEEEFFLTLQARLPVLNIQ